MEQQARILLVDDDPDLLRLLSIRLSAAGYRIHTAESGEQALSVLQVERPQLVVTDLRMGGMDGIALFDHIHAHYPTLPVIILTAHGSIPDAVEATKRGVYGFLTKPFDAQTLLKQVEDALRHGGGASAPEGESDGWRAEIVTRNPRMEAVVSEARMVAASDASVFIRGDSGTGKELLAKAIHRASPRAEQPFVAVNCGAIPEPLLESELFGHKRGAFTGASADHPGLIVSADGGTLFLDEIGDMPQPLQVKLLRVLQERQVRPVGATDSRPVDVRIISATHQDLDAAMETGQFREDLYYRLNVVTLELPSLSERREDIPLLANHFLQQYAAKYERQLNGFAGEAMDQLVAAPWPGNIRQLANLVEQVAVLSTGPVVPASLVQRALRDAEPDLPAFADARREFEREYLVKLLQITQGNVSKAARLAQRNRTEFYKLLNRHDINPGLFKRG